MNQYFEALAAQYPELSLARVVSQEKGIYKIICEGSELSAQVSGRLRHEAVSPCDFPTVGDYVMISDRNTGGSAAIQKLLPRKSLFVRRAAGTSKQEQAVAANIDIVFLCMSLNNDFNLRRLERYLSVAWDSGAKPVIVLTKSDLCGDIQSKTAEVESIALGVDILVTTSLENAGYAAVMPYLKNGVTASFLGSSGVGKSTLINRLLGNELLATNGLRNDDKGRHTTTRRELITLENGAMVIDTPGMHELGLWSADRGIDTAFSDIEELSSKCRYKNCTHTSEPGCEVLSAIKDGRLSAERFSSFKKLVSENAFAEGTESFLAAKEKKFKEISKINKANRKGY